jgi:hypothetical protein
MVANVKRGNGHAAAKTGPSKQYIRLLKGRINSKEYTDQVKKSVKHTARQLAES